MSYATEFTGEPGEAAPRGFRWWRVSADGELYSAWFDSAWDPTSNEATCALPVSRVSRRAWTKRHAGGVPAPGCSCGFYALHRVPEQGGTEPDPERPWLLDPEGWSGLGERVVFGVAEAWGRVLIGTEGWRSRYSRAIALYVPPTSELWNSDRLRLVSDRYGLPISGGLDSLVAEWAPEPIDGGWSERLQLATSLGGGPDLGTGTRAADGGSAGSGSPVGTTRLESVDGRTASPGTDRGPDRWPGEWSAHGSDRRPWRSPGDGASRTARQVAAVERLAGPGSKRILELGTGAGYRASPLAERGHSVVSVAGDFSRIDLPGPFDVIGYLGGFGVGSDDEQRYLLRQMARWAGPDGCILIEVVTPWFWAAKSSRAERGHGWAFDADSCRAQVRISQLWDDASAVTQALRCYAPADLRMLLDGTGLTLEAVEPFAGEGYESVSRLEDAKLYLAKLVPTR